MRILLVNDDGLGAPGLQAMEQAAVGDHDVVVVAPASERSAVSQGFTFHRSYRVRRLGEAVYSVDGTPVDCVMFALTQLGPFDAVCSGINQGANLAWDVWYSGTVGGALEAARRGVPAMAVSLDTLSWPGPHRFDVAAQMLVEYWRAGLWDVARDGAVVNVNFPSEPRLARQMPRLALPGHYVYNQNELEVRSLGPAAWESRVVQTRTLPEPSPETDGRLVRGGPTVSLLTAALRGEGEGGALTLARWVEHFRMRGAQGDAMQRGR